MSNNRDIGDAIFAFCLCIYGICYFFWGFERLRKKRLIEDIPTSTIRGLAMGLVELHGKAEPTTLLKSPLTKTECVLFKYLIEESIRTGKSSRWVKIASGDSFYCPFWLNDETGKIMVSSQGAELILPVDYEFATTGIIGKEIPNNLIEFMEENGIRYKRWLGNRILRFQEWFIRRGENVYVLGSAKKQDTSRSDYKNVLMQRIKELKKSPQKMKEEVDLNKDGEISIEEWDLAVAKLEQKLLEETLKNTQVEDLADVIVGKGDVETTFTISDHSEKEVIRKLSYQCFLGIYGGAALSLITLVYLLFWFGFFGFK